jgi:hypothetical protein
MQSTAQLGLNHLQLCSHTLGYCFPLYFKPAVLPCAAAVMGKTQEIERLGFTFSCYSLGRSIHKGWMRSRKDTSPLVKEVDGDPSFVAAM